MLLFDEKLLLISACFSVMFHHVIGQLNLLVRGCKYVRVNTKDVKIFEPSSKFK